MNNRLFWIIGIFAATSILALSPAGFPPLHTPGCVRPEPGQRYNLRLFKWIMRRKDAKAEKTLEVYRVNRVKPIDVRPVSDLEICNRAAVAYGRALNQPSSDRKVHILRVGDRFIVMDPDYQPDEYRRAMTFDSSFSKPLAMVVESP
jgi:hypothetical protein